MLVSVLLLDCIIICIHNVLLTAYHNITVNLIYSHCLYAVVIASVIILAINSFPSTTAYFIIIVAIIQEYIANSFLLYAQELGLDKLIKLMRWLNLYIFKLVNLT